MWGAFHDLLHALMERAAWGREVVLVLDQH